VRGHVPFCRRLLLYQPIVHKFDHSYVASVLRAYPDKFKGVCLANPTLGPDGAAAELAKLKKQGKR
jgi:predicted TIM-barrel fold metal-dependent hydrolase